MMRIGVDAFWSTLPAALDLYGTDAQPKDAVEAIRRDLKLAVNSGLIPYHAKFSITRRDYKSITVELVGWSGAVLVGDYATALMDHTLAVAAGAGSKDSLVWLGETARRTRRQSQDPRLSDEINEIMWLVERLADRHNFDKSQIETDYFHVGYYLHVGARGVIAAAERGIRLELDTAYADLLHRAHGAAQRLGDKVVRSICGKRGVDGCGEWSLEQLLKLDAKANGRALTYDKRGRRWTVAA